MEKKHTIYQHETTSYENNEKHEHDFDTNIEDLIKNLTNLNLAKQTQTRLNPLLKYKI